MKERAILAPQEYAARHKTAFRASFDFLNAHFPPEHTDEYWRKVTQDVGDVADIGQNDPLLIHMLLAVMNYLDEESHLRKPKGEETA